MSQAPARAWWAEVEHLREAAERRRAEQSQASEPQVRPGSARRLDGAASSDRATGPAPDPATGPAAAQRRTVKIRGQAIPTAPVRPLHEAGDGELAAIVVDGPWTGSRSTSRRRPRRRAAERVGHRPDRIALWAFLVGLLLVIIAAATAHGAPLPAHAHAVAAAAQLAAH
jgi:hypothetical protein